MTTQSRTYETNRPVVLVATGPSVFTGSSGQETAGACLVTAVDQATLDPVQGVPVRFEVVEGPIQLAGTEDQLDVETGADGTASVTVVFSEQGYALLAAAPLDNENGAVFFSGHSEGVTHELFIYSSPTFPVVPGEVTARIVAVDHLGRPVTGADLAFEGGTAADTAVEGSVKELGNGEYEGTFQTEIAGTWILTAEDAVTKVVARAWVHLLPEGPYRITLAEVDPRAAAPYGELWARARLEDRFGNALDPHRISGVGDFRDVVLSVAGDEAYFPVRFAGYGDVQIALADAESEIALETSIEFAAVWLADPGLVFEGDTFRTPVYALPRPDDPASQARVEIDFDPDMVDFASFEPAEGGRPQGGVEAFVEGDRMLVLELSATEPVHAEEFPDGVYLGTVRWTCRGEGEACFTCVGRMSPSTPGWKLCVEQKKRRKQKVCVNVMYKAGDATAKTKGITAAKQIPAVYSSTGNVAECCPVIEVDIKSCAIGAADWKKVIKAVGSDGKVSSGTEFDALFKANVCQLSKCINFMMMAMDWDNFDGYATGVAPFGTDRAFSVMKPEKVGSVARIGAHEAGHTLGLSHEGSSGVNLMSQYQPHGAKLTKDQCKKVWQNVGRYTG